MNRVLKSSDNSSRCLLSGRGKYPKKFPAWCCSSIDFVKLVFFIGLNLEEFFLLNEEEINIKYIVVLLVVLLFSLKKFDLLVRSPHYPPKIMNWCVIFHDFLYGVWRTSRFAINLIVCNVFSWNESWYYSPMISAKQNLETLY